MRSLVVAARDWLLHPRISAALPLGLIAALRATLVL
jgi:hypothetical protein